MSIRAIIGGLIIILSCMLFDVVKCQSPTGREPIPFEKGYLVWKGGRYQYEDCINCSVGLIYNPPKRRRRLKRKVRVNMTMWRAEAEAYTFREYKHYLP